MIVEIQRFDRIFQIETYEREESGKKLSFISHKSLEKLFYDMKAIQPSLTYTAKMLMANDDRVVFEGQILDGNQTYLPKIGESCASTLHGKIAQDYPVLIAHQRAFDRAFISYLSLDEKLYSDMEILNEAEKETDENILRPAIFRESYLPPSMKKAAADEKDAAAENSLTPNEQDMDFLTAFENTDVPINGYGKVKDTPMQALCWFANTMTDCAFGSDLRKYISLKNQKTTA